MKTWYKMLQDFHRAFDHVAPDGPRLQGFPFELRTKLILEEAFEFCAACGYRTEMQGETFVLHKVAAPDWPEMIDALCDLLYVTVGAFVSMGIEPDEFFAEVHLSNMAKLQEDGTHLKNEYGKTIKPEGWKPPRIGELLREVLVRHHGKGL